MVWNIGKPAHVLWLVLLLMVCSSQAALAGEYPEYELDVSVFPSTGTIAGDCTVRIHDSRETRVDLGRLTTVAIRMNGEEIHPDIEEGFFRIAAEGVLEIRYQGVFSPLEEGERVLSRENQIAIDGISLVSGWYPRIDRMARYRLTATLPRDFTAVSESENQTRTEAGDRVIYAFEFPYPLERLTLAADRWILAEGKEGDVEIAGYFIEEDAALAGRYIASAKFFLRLYEKMLGPYPYRRFSIVENSLPTGYSMPTLTLLGRAVVRLPFIVESSLGHEMLHQWFGNSVYIDSAGGNWAEGLTTYLSDHLVEERKGSGWHYRKDLMVRYQSYVSAEPPLALKDFHAPEGEQQRSVGYGKGAMVFHMLRKMVGEERFFSALRSFYRDRRFQHASWDDLRSAFEGVYGESLAAFFRQWIDRTDVPWFEIENPRIVYRDGSPTAFFQLNQQGVEENGPYHFPLRVRLLYGNDTKDHIVSISKTITRVEIPLSEQPDGMVIDPDYDLMRRLSAEEFPPVLSRLLGDPGMIVVVDPREEDRYDGLIEAFSRSGIATRISKNLKDREITDSSLLLLGENAIYGRLFGLRNNNEFSRIGHGFILQLKTHPMNSEKVVATAKGTSPEEVDLAVSKLRHYGNYSDLFFKEGKNVFKRTTLAQHGIRVDMSHEVQGVIPQEALSLEEIVERIKDAPVVFVGESHTNYEDHRVQLEIIRRMHEGGSRLAVGMEMFQRPFQKGIDDYLAGKISEKEFLRETEYYERWRYDYNLYRDILQYAKAQQIPVIALNIDGNISRKVARGGLDALSHEERKRVPSLMDMSDLGYRRRLEDVFGSHQHTAIGDGSFNNFYQAQILWDETMAGTVADFISRNPDFQMVVLAGNGHVMFGSGIPSRVKRLTGKTGAILLNGDDFGGMDASVADYVLFPEPLALPKTPMLGIQIETEEGRVYVLDVTASSPAEDAGMEEGDAILSIDGWDVRSFEDLKIALFDRIAGEILSVKVRRESLLLGDEDVELAVTLR